MESEDLLFTHRFIPSIELEDQDQTAREKFRIYLQEREKEKDITEIIKVENGKDREKYDEKNNFKYEKVSVVCLDTNDRDMDMYPNPNEFEMFLGKRFMNVKEIKLISTEFPNTDQVIRNVPPELQNNKVYWVNQEDVSLGVFYSSISPIVVQTLNPGYVNIQIPDHQLSTGDSIYIFNSTGSVNIDGERVVEVLDEDNVQFYWAEPIITPQTCDVDVGWPVYSVEVVPGNYTSDTLILEVSKEVNLVKRRRGVGEFHYFDVSVNDYTDVITFNSLELTQLGINPFQSAAGTGIITVAQNNHGYSNGELIFFAGTNQTSGIPSSTLNGRYNITVVDNDTFRYEVNINAIDSSQGGGNTVKTGSGAPFKLMFGSFGTTIQKNAGFPKEDSAVYIGTTNPIQTKVFNIANLTLGRPTVIETTEPHYLEQATVLNITTTTPGFPTVITTSVHGTTMPVVASIVGSNTTPSIDGEWTLTPISPTQFSINVETSGAGSIGKIKYGGDKVAIKGLDVLPRLGEIPYFHVENVTSTTFEIDIATTYIDPDSFSRSYIGTGLLTVTQPEHGFNTIESIEPYPLGDPQDILITFQLPHNLNGSVIKDVVAQTVIANTVDLEYTAHNLSTGDNVFLSDATTAPPLSGRYSILVVDSDTLRISLVGGILTPGTVTVSSGDQITISRSNSSPSIDGTYNVQYISPTEIKIDIGDGNSLTQNGTYALPGRSNKMVLYRAVSNIQGSSNLAGIPLQTINGNYRNIVRIIDANTYIIRLPDQYANSTVQGGGSNVYMSSEKHGYANFQSNTFDGTATGKLFRSISLEGENYVFLVSPRLNLQTVYSSSQVPNAFAKILLTQPPGNMMFNTFISSPATFDAPIAYLDSVYFRVLRKDGYLYNFNDINWSFSLEITEVVDSLNVTNVSSRNADQITKKSEKYLSGNKIEEIKETPKKLSNEISMSNGNF
jgi:hypothetical protein